MCWVALDRTAAGHEAFAADAIRSLGPGAQRIRDDIWQNFWNDELGHFTATRGGKYRMRRCC